MDGIELANGCYKTKKNEVVFPITEVVSQNEFFDYNAKYKGEVTEITPGSPQSGIDQPRTATDICHLRHTGMQGHCARGLHHHRR